MLSVQSFHATIITLGDQIQESALIYTQITVNKLGKLDELKIHLL